MIQALSFAKIFRVRVIRKAQRKLVYIILKRLSQYLLGLSSTKMHEDYLNNCKKHLKKYKWNFLNMSYNRYNNIMGRGRKMYKVLIVEDMDLTREDLISLIDWERYGFELL